MDEQSRAGAETPGKAAPTWMADAVVAVLLLGFGLTVVFASRKLGAGWSSDGPGAGYFPFYIGVILCISAVGILYQALASRKTDTRVFVDSGQLKQVLTVLVPSIVYVGAVQVVGLYVASALFIAGFMAKLGHYSWAKSAAVGGVTAAIFFLMFEVWFKVPLFKGALNPLSFLGY
jgi:hypothetical protein